MTKVAGEEMYRDIFKYPGREGKLELLESINIIYHIFLYNVHYSGRSADSITHCFFPSVIAIWDLY